MTTALQTLTNKLANRLDMGEGNDLIQTLKSTAFRGKEAPTDAQMTALLVVANQYGLNPWTKEIYAFPDKSGIVPVVGVDGWSRIINENGALDGIEFNQSETIVTMEGAKPCPEWIECVIHRKDRARPIVVREYLDEVYRPAFKKDSYVVAGPWQSHTKRFLRHKALIQCARLAFGFVGIYDEDEAQRIREVDMGKVEAVASITQERIQQLMANVQSATDLDGLKEVWEKGNKEFLEAKYDNKEFKEAVNKRKLELNTIEAE